MKTINSIVAATDLSAPARYAVSRSIMLAAAAAGRRLTLIHVASQSSLDELRHLAGIEPAAVAGRILDEMHRQLEALAAEGLHRGLQVDSRVVTGRVPAAVAAEADALGADLVVVGARSNDAVGRLLLGSTADRLLRQLERPVLMVRHAPRSDYAKVMVPVDFSASSLSAIRMARAVAPEAELVLMHAFVAPFESRLRMAGVRDGVIDDYLRDARQEALVRLHIMARESGLDERSARLSVRHGDAQFVILEEARRENFDLIAMGRRGQGFVEQMLLGSVTRHVLAESDGDVLVVGG